MELSIAQLHENEQIIYFNQHNLTDMNRLFEAIELKLRIILLY